MSRPEQIINGEHDTPRAWRLWLPFLLGLGLGPRAFDDVLGATAITALAGMPGHEWLAYVTALAQIAGLIAGGLVVDRYGVRSLVPLSLLAWTAAVTATAAAATLPSVQFLTHLAAVFAGCFFGLALPVTVRLVFTLWRRARALATLNILALAWLIFVPLNLAWTGWPPKPPSQPAWALGCLVAGGLGLMLALIWWLSFLRPDERLSRQVTPSEGAAEGGSLAGLLHRPGVWALVIVMTCHMQVFAILFRVLPYYMVGERFVPTETFTYAVAAPVIGSSFAQIGFALWSDYRALKTSDAARARVPFILAGALLCGAIGLLPFAGRGAFGVIYWVLAIGMATYPLAFTLGFDIVPRTLAGRFFGLTSAISVAVNAAIFLVGGVMAGATHSLACYFWLAGLAALIGFATTLAKLRHIEPIEESPTLARTIGKVFA